MRQSAMSAELAERDLAEGVRGEELLKVLAHNFSRLLGTRKLSRAFCMITRSGTLVALKNDFPATL